MLIKHLRGYPYNYLPPTEHTWVMKLSIEYPRRPLFCSSFAIPCWQKIRRPYSDMPVRSIKHHMTVNKLSTEAHDMTTAVSRCISHSSFSASYAVKNMVSIESHCGTFTTIHTFVTFSPYSSQLQKRITCTYAYFLSIFPICLLLYWKNKKITFLYT